MLDGLKEDDANALIETLNKAAEKIPELEIDALVQTLKHHTSYTLKMLKAVEENRLWNIVLSDLEYYKEKEKIRLQRESGGQA